MVALNIHRAPTTSPCSYKDGPRSRFASVSVIEASRPPQDRLKPQVAARLNAHKVEMAERGFVAQAFGVAVNICPSCTDCRPIRVDVDKYYPSRSQKRKINANSDLSFKVRKTRTDEEYLDLFTRYYQSRHPHSALASLNAHQQKVLFSGHSHMGVARDKTGKLVGFSLLNITDEGIIGNFSIYDLDENKDRSLGTMMNTWLIQHARKMRIPHVYFGAWAPDSNLQHKTRYRGAQLFTQNGWIDYEGNRGGYAAPNAELMLKLAELAVD